MKIFTHMQAPHPTFAAASIPEPTNSCYISPASSLCSRKMYTVQSSSLLFKWVSCPHQSHSCLRTFPTASPVDLCPALQQVHHRLSLLISNWIPSPCPGASTPKRSNSIVFCQGMPVIFFRLPRHLQEGNNHFVLLGAGISSPSLCPRQPTSPWWYPEPRLFFMTAPLVFPL